jgi:hypothetical protein
MTLISLFINEPQAGQRTLALHDHPTDVALDSPVFSGREISICGNHAGVGLVKLLVRTYYYFGSKENAIGSLSNLHTNLHYHVL